jgi:hypothetical protein
LLDIGAEADPIDRAVEHAGGSDLINSQGGNEGRGLPMAPRHTGNQSLTARATAIAARHVGRRTRFVDENQALWV